MQLVKWALYRSCLHESKYKIFGYDHMTESLEPLWGLRSNTILSIIIFSNVLISHFMILANYMVCSSSIIIMSGTRKYCDKHKKIASSTSKSHVSIKLFLYNY